MAGLLDLLTGNEDERAAAALQQQKKLVGTIPRENKRMQRVVMWVVRVHAVGPRRTYFVPYY